MIEERRCGYIRTWKKTSIYMCIYRFGKLSWFRCSNGIVASCPMYIHTCGIKERSPVVPKPFETVCTAQCLRTRVLHIRTAAREEGYGGTR